MDNNYSRNGSICRYGNHLRKMELSIYYILAILSAIIFIFVPQCGAIETIAVVISIMIIAGFAINLEARVKVMKNDSIPKDSIYKKTTPYSSKGVAIMSIVAAIVLCGVVIFIFVVGILGSTLGADTFTDGLAIIKIIDENHINSIGIPVGLVAIGLYIGATVSFIKTCVRKGSVREE